MKTLFSLLAFLGIAFISCNKDVTTQQVSESKKQPTLAARDGSGGSGSGSGSGGSTTTSTGLISAIGGAYRLIGGNNDSIQVNFTQPAPAQGWTVSFTTSDASVRLPATYFVPAGAYIIHVPLTSSVITSSKNETITVKLGAETKSYVLKVFPLHYSFPAPQLQSPGNGTGVKNRIQLKFQWSGNVNAYYHDIQVSDNTSFINPMLEVYLNDPIWAASYFNGLGRRYWRVRHIDGSGTPGPWSAVNWFEVKQ